MNTWESVGWLMLWVAATTFIQIKWPKRWHNGYIYKAITKIVHSPPDSLAVMFTFFGFALGISYAVDLFVGDRAGDAIYWAVLLLQVLDDYWNGDDDQRKKRWEAAKNKIKWLMELPQAQPVRVKS